MLNKSFQSESSSHSLSDVLNLAAELGYNVHVYTDSCSGRCVVRCCHDESMCEVFAFTSVNLAFVLESAWLALDFIRKEEFFFI